MFNGEQRGEQCVWMGVCLMKENRGVSNVWMGVCALKGTPSPMTTGPINLNVLKTQVLPVMGLCPSNCKKIKFILPVPGHGHVDAHASLADKFRDVSDISKPASRHLGK